MEGRDIVDGKERVPRDRYQWPLVVGILCALGAAALVDTKKRRSRGPEDGGADPAEASTTGAVQAAAGVAALCLAGLTSIGCADEGSDGDAAVEPWAGSVAEAVEAMESRVASGEHAEAVEVAARALEPTAPARFRARLDDVTRGASESVLAPLGAFLDLVGVASLQPRERGQLEFARGLAYLDWASKSEAAPAPADADGDAKDGAEERVTAARRSFSRALGAHAALRPVSLEALGDIDLAIGEALRATLPEVQGQGGLPAPSSGFGSSASGPSATGGEEAGDDDALENARAAYLSARGRYVECFAAGDAGDGASDGASDDARANSELCVRRLLELDRIEEQREQNEDQNQDDSESDEESEKDESKDESEQDKSEDSEKDESEQENSEDKNESEQEPGEEPPDDEPREPEPEGEEESEEEPEEPEPSEDESQEESDPEDAQPSGEEDAKAEEIEEVRMTQEELERLLEENREWQELGEKRRQQLARKRRIPTQKDW